MAAPAPGRLERDRDFLLFWAGQTVSVFGSQFTNLALPYLAVTALLAGPAEMGILAALGTAPFLFMGLFVGVWLDRRAKRPVLLAADLGRGLVVGAIAILAVAGLLEIGHLFVLALLTGILTVFFDVAYQAYMPALVNRRQLVAANSRLETSNSAAAVVGPSLAGPLVAFLSAPVAMTADAATFGVSGFSLALIRRREPPVDPGARPPMIHGIKEGLRVVLRDPRLRSIAACTGTSNFFASAFFALYILFAVRELGLDALALGPVLATGGIGALVGALTASAATKRLGVGSVIVLSAAIGGFALPPVALATPELAIPLLVASQVALGWSILVYNINQVSLRQALVPLRLQGRLNATMRFLVWGTIPGGSLIGGLLGQLGGLRMGLTFAAVGGVFAFLWVLFSPVRGIRKMAEVEGG